MKWSQLKLTISCEIKNECEKEKKQALREARFFK